MRDTAVVPEFGTEQNRTGHICLFGVLYVIGEGEGEGGRGRV